MAFLDWIKQRRQGRITEPKKESAERISYTAKGNPILGQSRSEWESSHDGVDDYRRHVGRSAEGFHGGLEVSHRREARGIMWSNARPTAEVAEKASRRMQEGHEYGFGPANRIRPIFAEWEHDYKLAKLRDETGREPEIGPEVVPPEPSRTEKQTPVKRVKVRSRDIPF